MRIRTQIAAVWMLFLVSQATFAMPTYSYHEFDVEFNFGPLDKQSAVVSVSLLNVTGVGLEVFAWDAGNLLFYVFSFGDEVFGKFRSDPYLDSSTVLLADGLLHGVLMFGGMPDGIPRALIDGTDLTTEFPKNVVLYIDPDGVTSSGLIDADSFRVLRYAIPTPATLSLFVLGMAVIAGHRRKRIAEI